MVRAKKATKEKLANIADSSPHQCDSPPDIIRKTGRKVRPLSPRHPSLPLRLRIYGIRCAKATLYKVRLYQKCYFQGFPLIFRYYTTQNPACQP